MASYVDPLAVARVIGDVIDRFVPIVTMSVYYGPKRVSNGCSIKPSAAENPPNVEIVSGRSDEFYTLVMTDPDAPSPSEPSLREWVHWIVADIPGGSSASRGKEVLSYMPPRPPIGIHRFIFILFKQKTGDIVMLPPPARNNFRTREFANQYGLDLPVATVYFNGQKEPAKKRR